ncbi:MAG: hypothetical protein ABEI57_03330 [Halapricum sp.]
MARVAVPARSSVSPRRLVFTLQLVLVGVLVAGVVLLNVSVILNAVFGLAVTVLPTVIERDFEVHLSPVLALWITVAAVLHSLGMVGVYDAVSWWDHLTHAFSGALVAALGYSVTCTVDEYVDDIYLPPTFLWVFVFLVTIAVGVCWETLEFVGRDLARFAGFEPLLIVYGVQDTILDLVFDIVGAVLVAALARVGGGRALIAGIVTSVARR